MVSFVDVETWCPKKKQVVLICLDNEREQKGDVVEGKPVHCQFESVCTRGDSCLLNALRIETRRK